MLKTAFRPFWIMKYFLVSHRKLKDRGMLSKGKWKREILCLIRMEQAGWKLVAPMRTASPPDKT
jgi:hypothetical protein